MKNETKMIEKNRKCLIFSQELTFAENRCYLNLLKDFIT